MKYTTSPTCQIKDLPAIYEKCFGERPNGHYVEVGAFNGVNWSCSLGLARLGWKGLLFEPNPEYYVRCVENYTTYPNVRIIPQAVGSYDGTTKLYLGGSNTTTVPEMVDVYNSMDWSKISGLSHEKFITCPITTLDTALALYGWPQHFDLLVVDVEGAEPDVLWGLSLDYWRVDMMIVETHEKYPDVRLSKKAEEVDALLLPYGYEKIYADTINAIYWKSP